MDNYNNIINQQYGNIVYSNNMMQTNMPMQQNPSLIAEPAQHIQNDTRLPPNLMEPRVMQMVSENTNLTSDSMRIADTSLDQVQNTFVQSGGDSSYNTNYVDSITTNENDIHNLNIPEPKLHEDLTSVHPHLMHEDKYKQHPSEPIEPIMTQPSYEPVNLPTEPSTQIPEELEVPSTDINDDFKLTEEKPEDKIDMPEDKIDMPEDKIDMPEDKIDIAEDKIDMPEDKIDMSVDNISESENKDNADVDEGQAEVSIEDKDSTEPDMDVDKEEEKSSFQLDDPKVVDEQIPSDEYDVNEKSSDLPKENEELPENNVELVDSELKTEFAPEVKPVEEDYSTTCRVCLKTSLEGLIDMCDQDGVLKILDKIMLCASVQITKNDGLPCHICESCINKLHIAYDFKITCESSDVELRKRLNIAAPKTVVKTEFVLIECDDQDYDLDVSENEKPRAKRRYKEDTDDDFVSDSQEDSGSDSSYAVNKPKSKRKSKRRTRSISKRQLPKRDRRTKEWRDSIASTPDISRKRTKYIVDPDDDKPLITIKKVKSEEKTPKHACEICNKTFPYLSFLKQHMLTHQDKEAIIKCKYCTAKFTKHEDYKQHTLDYHAEDMDEDYPILPRKSYKKSLSKTDSGGEEEREKERTPRERNKHHKCPYCDVVCNSAIKLKEHKRTHVGEKPFVCHICQKPFKQTVSLESHIRRHAEDKSLQCDHCQKICASKSDLNRHIKTEHSDVKHFECAICNKEFPTKLKLDKHVLKHEKEDEELSQTSKEGKEKKVPSTKDLFKSIAPITSTYWSDSYSD